MECSVCGEIIHPSCSEKKAPCKISKKVNNSWECPKCCQSDDEVSRLGLELHVIVEFLWKYIIFGAQNWCGFH